VYSTDAPRESGARFEFTWSCIGKEIMVPHWFLMLFFIVLAALPWLLWATQFGLRTLFVVTTLVSLVLGLDAYFARK
jgi:hypothetical protein